MQFAASCFSDRFAATELRTVRHGNKFFSAFVVARRTAKRRSSITFWRAVVLKCWYSAALMAIQRLRLLLSQTLVWRSPHSGTAAFPKYDSCQPELRAPYRVTV